MRILYVDIDSCRPDHLGCYGYHRNTSPHIDALAKEGMIFTNCYTSDAPCLPSRTALFWGQFGFKTGVVNHGGRASQMFLPQRDFSVKKENTSLAYVMAQAGYHTCSISTFVDRHSAGHVALGWREIVDCGKHGDETAEEVNKFALPWLKNHAKEDKWFLHLNYWDPHRPYRTPMEYGNSFKNDPPPNWPDQQTIDAHFKSYGPRSASEPIIFPYLKRPPTPREVSPIRTVDDFKTWIDGYDTGIRYADDHLGEVIKLLKEQGVWDETMVIVSADHGENQGELNIYGEHATADQITLRVPLIVRWPGVTKGTVNSDLLYQLDLTPTICEMAGARIPKAWDGQTITKKLKGESSSKRPYLVMGQCAHVCQRSVRLDHWLMIRTYHTGLHALPEILLFDVEKDPHETTNLAAERPDIVHQCTFLLHEWAANFQKGPQVYADPMVTVLQEGGPHHAKNFKSDYCDYLRNNGKAWAADEIMAAIP
jgi:choline-sulfatase